MVNEKTINVLELEPNEYLVSPNSKMAKNYKVYFNGIEVKNVTGIIRVEL